MLTSLHRVGSFRFGGHGRIAGAALLLLSAACSSSGQSGAPDLAADTPQAPQQPTPDVVAARPNALTSSPPPISGGTLAVLADGKTAVASDPDRDRVYVVDLGARKVKASLALQPGDEPGRVVEDGEGLVHVALRGGGAVLTVNPREGAVAARRAVCPAPRGLAFDPRRGVLHVACAGGELVSLATKGAAAPSTRMLDRDLRDVVVSGGRLYVSSFRRAELFVLDGAAEAVRKAPPRRMSTAFQFFGGKPLGGPVSGMTSLEAAPAVAWKMVPYGEGGALMLHQRGADAPLQPQPGGYVAQGCGGFVEPTVTTFAPDGASGVKARTGPALTGAALTVDVAVSPSGRQIAIVAAGNRGQDNAIQFVSTDRMVDPEDGSKASEPCMQGSSGPEPEVIADPEAAASALPAPGSYLPPNGEVIAVAFDKRGNVLVQSREPAMLQILTQRGEPITLSTESRLDLGHRLFHSGTKGGMACASCHPEGGDDARVWNFANIGPRRTQSLRGGIMKTAPFHWDGDMRDMTHLMSEVFDKRMAGGVVDGGRVSALNRWMDSIPMVKPSRWKDDGAIARGRALFFDAQVGCASCHAGSLGTNNETVDVGTGRPFQVPQLKGLAFRFPYMHDGCAPTLEARFAGACGGGDRHGVTSKLGQAQISDLVAFLETL